MPENREAAEIYMICQNQLITTGMGQIVDISIPAVKIVMDIWQVSNQKKCLLKILDAFRFFRLKDKESQG